MNKIGFRFREWDIYKDAILFRNKIISFLKDYPDFEKYALADQTRRALNSVILNLAEGANRSTEKDMKVYINRSRCSLDEVVACLDCALDDGYIIKNLHSDILSRADSLAKRLNAFEFHIKASISGQ